MTILPKPAATTNFRVGRRQPVDLIVLHVMQGHPKGTALRFADPEARVSAHYGIGVDGAIYQYVAEGNTAWHAGNSLFNDRSVGIELEGDVNDPDAFTLPMMESLKELCLGIVARWKMPIDRAHIIGHDEVPDPYNAGRVGGHDHHQDPGRYFPREAFVLSLAAAVMEAPSC